MYRRLLVFALIATVPVTARAQFTTFIRPRPKAVESVKPPVANAAPAIDTANAKPAPDVRLTDMKTWVDSAAGIALTPKARTVPGSPPARSVPAARSPAATRSNSPLPSPAIEPDTAALFRNGVPAPETASSLPLVALIGMGLVALGMVIVAIDEVQPREAILANRDAARNPDRWGTRP